MLTFGERLKRARERKGMTQQQVKNLISVSDKSLSRYETNVSSPDPETITKLIKLYDVSADYILGLSPIMGESTLCDEKKFNIYSCIYKGLDELSDEYKRKVEEYVQMLCVYERSRKKTEQNKNSGAVS